MCGILGGILRSPSDADLDQIRQLFINLQVRGQHATGLSWLQNDRINTNKLPLPADVFLKDIDLRECLNEDGNLYFIGHVRYSTSDLEYNQPIGDTSLAIAHNGVISQEAPETWEETYGLKCLGKNDSELIYAARKAGHIPLDNFANSSMAVVELRADRRVVGYRNNSRPLWYSVQPESMVFASTFDSLNRSEFTEGLVPVSSYESIMASFDESGLVQLNRTNYPNFRRDLQNAL